MTARRTRRMSSSLLPLNITPAMTSIHPPLWWNGPLGPLTSGRDLYGVILRVTICRVDRHDRADYRDPFAGLANDHRPPTCLANGRHPRVLAAQPRADSLRPGGAVLFRARGYLVPPRLAPFRRTPGEVAPAKLFRAPELPVPEPRA